MAEVNGLSMNWRSVALALIMCCACVALVYLLARQIERKAALLLAAFALACMVTATPMVIGFAGAYDRWPGLTFLPTDFTLFFGPFLYLHARRLMSDAPLGRDGWLLVPGGLYCFYQWWAFTLLGDYRAKWAYTDAVHDPYVDPAVFFLALSMTGIAIIAVWRLRRRYLRWLEHHRSDGDQFDPVWLSRLVLLAVPLAVVWAVQRIASLYFGFGYVDQFWFDLAGLFLIFLMAVEALARLQRPFPKMRLMPQLDVPASAVSGRDWSAEAERLRAAVLDQQWYLEPALSLADLATRTASNQAYVSRALNQGLGVRFSDFINSLRVQHAQHLMADTSSSMLDIAMASGFGSKASFNRAFRLHAGQTPTEFMRALADATPGRSSPRLNS